MAPPKRKGGRTLPATKDDEAVVSSRVTEKGTVPSTTKRITDDDHAHHAAEGSTRYTPPIPKEMKVSPRWVPILMFTLLGLGAVIIVVNYLGVLPGGTDNVWLLVGLGLILAGIVVATQYH